MDGHAAWFGWCGWCGCLEGGGSGGGGLIQGARIKDEFGDLAEAKEVAFSELRDGDLDLADEIEAMKIFVIEADLKGVVFEEDKDLFLLPVRTECIALDIGL